MSKIMRDDKYKSIKARKKIVDRIEDDLDELENEVEVPKVRKIQKVSKKVVKYHNKRDKEI